MTFLFNLQPEARILQHALKYARLGRPVFPCADDKSPLTSNGFKDANSDCDFVRAAWKLNPHALIGSPTGNGTIVIDIDGEEGEASLASLSFGLSELPPTRESSTGRGRHLWFRVPCPIRNSLGKLGPGIDVRGDGGYVILPPSRHPNGKSYQWTSDREVAELPADWLEIIKDSNVTDAANPSPQKSDQIPAGERHRTLASVAGTMRNRGMGYDAILAALLAMNEKQCNPPKPRKEIESIAKSYAGYPAGKLPAAQPSPIQREIRLVVRCFKDIEPREVKWLWPQVFPLGKVSMLVGDPGLGKSLITIDLAARLSVEGKLPGAYGPIGSSIFLTSEDDEGDTLRPRLDVAGADVSRIHIIQMAVGNGVERMFNLSMDLEALEEVIKSTGSILVVIDPVSAYLGGSDSNNNADVRSVLGPLSVVARRRGCAVITINHFRKSSGPAVQKSAMSMAFSAHARAVWGVARLREDPPNRVFVPIKSNLGLDAEGWKYQIRDVNGVPRVEWGEKHRVENIDYLFNGPTGYSNRSEGR